MFFYFEKNVKNVKRTYIFIGHLITPGFNTKLPKVIVPASHQHQTTCSVMQTQETVQLRTV